MGVQAISYEEQRLVSRLAQERRFVLDYLDTVLRFGEGSEITLAFARLALVFDGVALSPDAIDPEEARSLLERLRGLLKLEAREISLA